jgi:hypothetical protein
LGRERIAMDWINDVYAQGTLENKLAKKIWFLDSSRLFQLLKKDLGKKIPKDFIESHRDEITKHFMNGNIKVLAEKLNINIGNLTK